MNFRVFSRIWTFWGGWEFRTCKERVLPKFNKNAE